MFASRNTRLAVVCLLLTAVTACSRRHESNDFLPSSPEFQRALQIVLEALSVPADGASTVRIEAQISPNADPDKRRVRFETTLGSWVDPDPEAAAGGGNGGGNGGGGDGGATAAGRTATRDADSEGRAVAFLKAAKEAGVAVITVSVLDKDGKALATVSGEVTFAQVTDALELRLSSAEVVADDKTEIVLEAEISADSPAEWKEIEFSTTRGSLNGQTVTGNASEPAKVVADADRIARARLKSATPGSATVTAKIVQFPSIAVNQLVTFTEVPSPVISATPESLDFGNVQVGTSSDLPLLLGNHGTVPLTVTAWTVKGTDAARFAVVSAPSRPATIAPAGSIQLTVRFSPNEATAKSAELEVESNDKNKSKLTVTLAGKGAAAPNIVVDGSLAFGSTTAGTSVDKPLTITNNGGSTLTLDSLLFSNAKFSLVGTAPSSIAPGATVQVTLRFSPDLAQAETGTLSIASNDPDTPLKAVSLTGTGT